MGRKKRRRTREVPLAGNEPEVGVEIADFEVDDMESPAPEPPAAAAVATSAAATPAATLPLVVTDPNRNVQTLGELLQQAREARGLSIEEASARTRIASSMLRHLESDRFGEFDADAYVKGFLRNYGGFLGLDVGMLLRRYEAISGRVVEREPELLEVETHVSTRRRSRQSRPWVWTIVIIAVAALAWVFWSRAATRLGLRSTPGLEQIENELRTRRVPPAPDPRQVDDLHGTPGPDPVPVAPMREPAPGAPGAEPAPPPPAARAAATAPVRPTRSSEIEDLVPPGPR